jgi:hypothetical protein
MEAAEANDAPALQAVLAATPFVKFVLNFSEQLDAACRKRADRTAAVLLPWCDLDAWRQCLVVSAQLQDCHTLHHLLCDVDDWPAHDAFRATVTEDQYLAAARPSLKAAAATTAAATPYREKVAHVTTLNAAPCMAKGPWQRRHLLDTLPAGAGGRHLVLQRAAEAAALGHRTELLHAVLLLAMEPLKSVPFGAVTWQPRTHHWIHPVLERARVAVGALLVRGEIALGKLRNFSADVRCALHARCWMLCARTKGVRDLSHAAFHKLYFAVTRGTILLIQCAVCIVSVCALRCCVRVVGNVPSRRQAIT